MTTEERLVDALREADAVEPSPDLFARLERSIDEDRAHRRRLLVWVPAILLCVFLVGAWVASGVRVDAGGELVIQTWRLVVGYLALASGVIVGLGPHLRRFGEGFLDGVFLLDRRLGRAFIRVLDIAYYAVFVGLMLVNADQWDLGSQVGLQEGLQHQLEWLAVLLASMGVLHVANLLLLPFLGLICNATIRREERRDAGDAVPPESQRARVVDSSVQTIVIVAVVLSLALALMFVVGGPVGSILDSLP